ncbi:transmembrane 9 superfamily member 5 [Quercus suber]|uniref:Transmembrane 9 superfamily member n=1 Tax=Quercus suber TaxID=58331 RepID=A0AAW0M811_QUESU
MGFWVQGYFIPLWLHKTRMGKTKECVIQTGALYPIPVILTSLATTIEALWLHKTRMECVIQTGALYPIPVILTSLATTIEAKTTSYLIFFFFIAIVLLTFGGRSGLTSLNESEITCSTRHFQSEIPNQAWYMRTPAQMFLGGLLSFSIIYSMMDDIYASLYSLKVCGAFSTTFIAFVSVIALTVICVSRGINCLFMFAYGLYFYARAKAKISLSVLKFVGYNACIFYAVFLILGTIGFYASSIEELNPMDSKSMTSPTPTLLFMV